jgi:bifunctional non-homologous end joining protein LigD
MLMRSPLARERRSPPDFIRPALLTPATTVPTGPGWIHELKHDGIRLIARKDGARVQLWSRYGRNRTSDFTAITAALQQLPSDVVLDGEAVAHCDQGLPDFHRTLSAAGQRQACLHAFDLLSVDGEDLRPLPLLARRTRLQALFAAAPPALRFSEHMDGPDGERMFRHACALGLEGIVSKKASARSDRTVPAGARPGERPRTRGTRPKEASFTSTLRAEVRGLMEQMHQALSM